MKNNVQIRSQFCTCHDSWAVITCAKLWLIRSLISKLKWIDFLQDFNHDVINNLWNGPLVSTYTNVCQESWSLYLTFRDHSGYGQTQWETTLYYKVISHWLSPTQNDPWHCCLPINTIQGTILKTHPGFWLKIDTWLLSPICCHLLSWDIVGSWLFMAQMCLHWQWHGWQHDSLTHTSALWGFYGVSMVSWGTG